MAPLQVGLGRLWRAAFEVASLADMEARLKRFGVEYHKFIVPGTNAAQIFLWDPEGCAANCSRS